MREALSTGEILDLHSCAKGTGLRRGGLSNLVFLQC